jgi:hypothetical protein
MGVSFSSGNTSTIAVVTMTGGAGEDTFTGRTGNTGKDVFNGGAAADTYVVSTGADEFSGGAGADTAQFSKTLMEANSTTTLTSTYDGGAGTDIIQLLTDDTHVADADFRGMTSFESIVSKDGTNTFTLAENADALGISTITGGAAVDTVDISDADFDNALTFIQDDARAVDVLTGWTTGSTGDSNVVSLGLSALETAGTTGVDTSASDYIQLFSGASVVAGEDIVLQVISADTTAAVTGANVFIIAGTTAASVAAAVNLMEDGGTRSISTDGDLAANDNAIFVYSDGTDAFVSSLTVIAADTTDGTIVDTNLEGDHLIKLSGIDAITATTFDASDFAFIA